MRVQKWDTWTGAHQFSWGPGGVVLDSDGFNNNTVYTPGLAHREGTTDRFYHSDWLGSTRYLSDSTGISFPGALRYDAYGNRSATGGTDGYHPTDFQFAGGWGYQQEFSDATVSEPGLGLQYLQNRYYDPAIGRFISPDPIGFAGGLNLYRYAGNNPVSRVDPRGLIDFESVTPVLREQLRDIAVKALRDPDGALQDLEFLWLACNGQWNAAGRNRFEKLKSLVTRWSIRFKVGPLRYDQPDLSRKLDFVFGLATGRKHNLDRSRAMLAQIRRIGLHDTPEARLYITEHLVDVLRNPRTVVGLDSGSVVRESLLSGPRGFVKIHSYWKGNYLTTVKIFN